MDAGIYLGWGIAICFIGGIAYLTWRGIHQLNIRRAISAYLQERKREIPELSIFNNLENKYAVEIINRGKIDNGNGVFTLSGKGIAIYQIKTPPEISFEFEID